MTTATNNVKPAKVAKTEAAAKPAIDTAPVATGLMGGNGEFMFWPELNVYAAMVAGKPDAFQLTPDMWEMMKNALVPVESVKAQVAKAALAAAKATVYQYTITTAIVFESTEVLDPATDLTWETVQNLAVVHGFEDKTKTVFKLHPGKKSGGSRTSTGESKGSGFIKAESFEELRPLGDKALEVAKAMHKENTSRISLDRWHEFGYANRQAFVDSRSNDWYRKGYNGAMSSGGGYITLYPERMYSGYTLLDTLDKAE